MKNKVLMIQPPILQSNLNVDEIQKAYWKTLSESVTHIMKRENINHQLTEREYNFTGFVEPNIGFLYIASILKQNNYEIKYIDFHLLDAEIRDKTNHKIEMNDIYDTLKNIEDQFFDIIAISPLTVNFKWAIEISKIIKNQHPKSIIILGGVHVSFDYERILTNYKEIDYIIVGEGEQTIIELLNCIQNKYDCSKVKGVAYKQGNEIFFSGSRNFIDDLDELPYPLYSLLPKKYFDSFIVRILTSRGCSNNCSFCVPSKVFNKLRYRSVNNVIDEIEYYINNYGKRVFMLGDLNFMSDYDYTVSFCNEIITRKLKIIWFCQSRADLVDKNIVKLMKRAGCIMICIGIESAEQELLDNTDKKATPNKCIEACEIIRAIGVNVFTFWVFGLPGETHQSAHKTIVLLREMIDKDLIQYTHCSILVPYPGTELFKNPEASGINILSDNFNEYWMGCDYLGAGLPVIETKELSKYEIYAYWQLALSVVAGNLNKHPF
ncbi:B12-binding domain-containing radical SAM protein [Anaerovorax odorimutans]|uniref:B12-binding domain-containing radical SAM protein n=1 Tax=Anaerovorax odorimutans TaxID=109327 RepID=A0ABT1RTI2_9FIRM|nr:radical SAM protein [Anaerovorax odorimutans]MCQ4638487.1 B12-binding domain-containing radical SAM protein [Anaerovorax odorimutans]